MTEFEDLTFNEYSGEAVGVLSQDQMWIYWAQTNMYSGENPYYFMWRKINTYTRRVEVERKYYSNDPTLIAYLGADQLWYLCGDVDVDELNRTYAGGYTGCVTRFSGSTFTIEKHSPVPIAYSNMHEWIKVSRNPAAPYLWYGDTHVFLVNRETMANPFDSSQNAFWFPSPMYAGSYCLATAYALLPNDGSIYILYSPSAHLPSSSIERLYPNGTREVVFPQGTFSSYSSHWCHLSMAYDELRNQLIIGCNAPSTNGNLLFLDLDSRSITHSVTGYGPFTASWSYSSHDSGFKRGVINDKLYYITEYGKIIEVDCASRTASLVKNVYDDFPHIDLFDIYCGLYVDYKGSMFVGIVDEET